MRRWLHTDELEEAVSALEFTLESASKLVADVSRWRWVIIGIHGALQGFMVIALRRSDGRGPVPNEIIHGILDAHRAKTPVPRETLHKFLVLFRLLRTPCMDRFVHSKRFQPQGTQTRSIRQLNSLRNEFIHFTPKCWSLEVSGLPQICLDCLAVIHFLEAESGNIFWSDLSLSERASKSIVGLIGVFEALRNEYEASSS